MFSVIPTVLLRQLPIILSIVILFPKDNKLKLLLLMVDRDIVVS